MCWQSRLVKQEYRDRSLQKWAGLKEYYCGSYDIERSGGAWLRRPPKLRARFVAPRPHRSELYSPSAGFESALLLLLLLLLRAVTSSKYSMGLAVKILRGPSTSGTVFLRTTVVTSSLGLALHSWYYLFAPGASGSMSSGWLLSLSSGALGPGLLVTMPMELLTFPVVAMPESADDESGSPCKVPQYYEQLTTDCNNLRLG
ncbi:hypothetical protein OH76DRAFT_1418822 [Lentinus brumalis]|uniref:Uncharacterized protein n=1 Tax=Lentinus brumalis TaxID=2498619 RepID=A0A371D8K4_9APHY|nr:hypothetical protein OH76DRAFT_1418822 [Polyporus brumalis]